MPSLRARLYNLYLKRTLKPAPLWKIDPAILRANADRMAPKKPPSSVELELVEERNFKGEWHRAADADGLTILYFHGGGYYYCSPRSHRNLTFALARMARANLFSLDYRMAPEHKFPAAVDDAVAAYEWLLAKGAAPEKLIVAGDSAGGGLTLALMQKVKERGLPLPAGLIIYSAWTDLAGTGASLETNLDTETMFNKDDIIFGATHYLGDMDRKMPLASPLYAELDFLPPILIYVSDEEVLLSDSTRLHEKLIEKGVDARLVVEHGLAHIWPIFYPKFPEAGKTIAQSAKFIREVTG